MKQLKDYLHLYLGCDGIDHNGNPAYLGAGTLSKVFCGAMSFKPILRPLSDMTEEEMSKVIIEDRMDFWTPEEFMFLLSKHFDLFGLIEAGLAKNKTTL